MWVVVDGGGAVQCSVVVAGGRCAGAQVRSNSSSSVA